MDYIAYLAGPVTGLSYDDNMEWRTHARTLLSYLNIDGMNPMRGQEYLSGLDAIGDAYEGSTMSTQRAIMAKSFNDVVRADVVIVNLLGAQRVSIGTVMEMAWAFQAQIPVIGIMEDADNLHDHSMVREAFSFRVKTVDDAVKVADALLNGKPRYDTVKEWQANGRTKLPPK